MTQATPEMIIEAALFAAAEPLSLEQLKSFVPADTDVSAVLGALQNHYSGRGVQLVEVAGKMTFRTAPAVAPLLTTTVEVPKKLSRAATEVLAIIAYHQPITRAEIEAIRGVSLAPTTLDLLLEIGWIEQRGHKEVPGRPQLWVTSENFLSHFNLRSLTDLPGLADMQASGLFAAQMVIREFSAPPPANQAQPAPAASPASDAP